MFTSTMWHVVARKGPRNKQTIQQPLLSNGTANKYFSTEREHSNDGRDVFYAVSDEIL
jgi:hypothetical protein